MKKVICFFLSMALISSTLISFSEGFVIKINTGSNPNVRSLPSVEGTVLGIAQSGAFYEVIANHEEKWYKIQLDNGVTGWISAKMATVIPQAVIDSANKTDQAEKSSTDNEDKKYVTGNTNTIANNSLSEDYIIDRLSFVQDIAFIAPATESNDPNGLLGKQGGYIAQIYFSSPLVNPSYSNNPDLDIVKAGTECGGSIEVYSTIDDAAKRDAYLGLFDGAAISSGSHTIFGTMIIRTSSRLSASEQSKLEAEIIEALTASSTELNESKTSNNQPYNNELVSIIDKGFQVSGGYLYYSFIARSNLNEKVILYPEFRIASRNKKGELISTSSQVLMIIYPGQEIMYAGLAGAVDETPSSIEIEYIEPDDSWHIVNPTTVENSQFLPIEIRSSRLKQDTYFPSIVGELYNPNSYNIETLAVSVLFKDEKGNLLAGETTFINGAKAKKAVPFEISITKKLIGGSFIIYAQPW